jgi:hypothetical protein
MLGRSQEIADTSEAAWRRRPGRGIGLRPDTGHIGDYCGQLGGVASIERTRRAARSTNTRA